MSLFCSDLDGTLLGLPDASRAFCRAWEALGEGRPTLIYSTGRLLEDARRVVAEAGLPQPDYYVGGVGTMICEAGAEDFLRDYASLLSQDWDRAKAVEVVRDFGGLDEQPEDQQHAWKSSWFWDDAQSTQVDALRGALRQAGVTAQVIYSSGRDLDVLPSRANKGNALRWLATRLDTALGEVVVAGDTGNDASMFDVEEVRGIVPANAAAELVEGLDPSRVYRARGRCAAGIVEGLAHFGVLAARSDPSA